MDKGMSTARLVFWLLFLVIAIGLVLRYGLSSHLLAQDVNGILQTLTLQGSGAGQYYGPQSVGGASMTLA